MYAHPAHSRPLLTSLHNYSSQEEQEDERDNDQGAEHENIFAGPFTSEPHLICILL